MSRRLRGLFRLAPIFLLAATVCGCATVPVTGRSQLNLISEGEMLTMSQTQYGEVLKEAKISKDPAANAQVVRVGKRIADAVDAYNREIGNKQVFEWEFNVIDDPETVNAWCMPGGKIAVYTGILPVSQDDAGLAVVLGHEVGHALARHGNERVSQAMAAQLAAAAAGGAAAAANASETTQALAVLGSTAVLQYGVLMPYGRNQELEADRIGLILMAKAGYDPRAAVPFWQRMAATGGGAPPEFLSTHPSNQNRINEINRYLPDAMKEYEASPRR